MKTIKKFLIRIFAVCIVVIILNYLWLNFFYFATKKEYVSFTKIPDLKNGYIPQGLCFLENHNLILQTSYSKKNPSKVYVIDFTNGDILKELTLKDSKNDDLYIHAGGIASDENTIWICGDNSLYIFSLSEILATNENFINSAEKIDFPVHTDFCYYQTNKNILWIGEFISPFDRKSTAYLLGYHIESHQPIENAESPDYKIVIPSMVQGFCIDSHHNFIFSRSYTGFILSFIDIHKNILDSGSESSINYSYKNSKKISRIRILPMSEGIFFKDGNYYILFESGAKRYLYAFPKIKNVLILN